MGLFWNCQDLLLMMGTEIFKINASWAEILAKTRVSFLMTPTVRALFQMHKIGFQAPPALRPKIYKCHETNLPGKKKAGILTWILLGEFMQPFWSSLTLLVPLNFKEEVTGSFADDWPYGIFFFWIYGLWCDTICPDSVLSWFSAGCWTAECSCGATLQCVSTQSCPYKTQSATQLSPAVARCRAGATHNTLLTIFLRTEIVLQQTNLLKLITPFSIQLNKTLNQRWAHGDDRLRVKLLAKHYK